MQTAGKVQLSGPSQPGEKHVEKYFSPDACRAELGHQFPGATLIALLDTTDPPAADLTNPTKMTISSCRPAN
jgi:hypothetical protein